MFYSHQLLSKKGPLGQIWIAATMQAKINRRKAEQINISDICSQILEPEVPLALRLSGILMGGVVLVYSKKVTFLLNDFTEFLIKLKRFTTAPVDHNLLPKGKENARYEAITIDYGYNSLPGFPADDLLRPDTPERGRRAEDIEYFTMPRAVHADPPSASVSSRQQHQATYEDITLNEVVQEDHQHQFGRNMQEEVMPPVEPNPDMFAEINIQIDELLPAADELLPNPALETIFEEQQGVPVEEPVEEQPPTEKPAQADHEAEAPKSPEPDQQNQRPQHRRRKKRVSFTVIDTATEIPSVEFNRWLHDSSDITGRRKKPEIKKKPTIDDLFKMPSTMITCKGPLPVSSLPSEIINAWQRSVFGPPLKRKQRDNVQVQDEFDQAAPPVQPDLDMPDLDQPIGVPAEDFASVEKLRAAGKTPSTSGQDQANVTPATGPTDSSSQRERHGKSGSRSGSGSGRLPLQPELGDVPTGRSKKSRVSDFLDKDNSPEIAALGAEIDFSPQFGNTIHGVYGGIGATLSQFELLEETVPTQASQPFESINKTTASLIQFFREQFEVPGQTEEISLNMLTQGLEKWRAAKLFFQINVLASNLYLSVNQQEPYGDIILRRGRYL